MSRGVDVLAVMEKCHDALECGGLRHVLAESIAVVAQLIEAAEAYAEAEAALAARELEGINAESLDRMQPRANAAYRDLENALARVRGAA